MLEIRRLDLKMLPEKEQSAFTAMSGTYTQYTEVIPHVTIGAYWDDKPVGIIVASYIPIAKKGEVELLFVLEPYRRRGIGLKMLLALEEILRDELDCSVLVLSYSGDNPHKVPLEHVLRLHNWRQPTLLLKRYYYNVQDFHASWFEKPRLLPHEVSLHSWSELKHEEKHRLEVQAAQGAYPYAVYPYGKGGLPEPINSVFLRHQGSVIGWLATHRQDAETIVYSGLYVHLDYRSKGYSMLLMAEGIRRQKESPVPTAMFELNATQVSEIWRRFVAGSLAPYAFKQTEVFTTWKELRENLIE